MRLFALRGANSVAENSKDAIVAATAELLKELLKKNQLEAERIVSCIFTLTEDLNAEFPAVAARNLGLNKVPLLCAQEVPVPDALPKIVRVLIHYYADEEHTSQHVYLGEAKALRTDISEAQ